MRVSSPLAARSLDYTRARTIIIYHLQHRYYPVEKGKCFNNSNNYYYNNDDNNIKSVQSLPSDKSPSLPG